LAISRVSGLQVEQKGDVEISPSQLLPLPRPADIAAKAYTINLVPGPGRGVRTSIGDIRATLAPLGQFDLQEVGAAGSQEFIARLGAKGDDPSFQTNTETKVMEMLTAKYGADQVILKRTDFVGPRLSQSLATQSVWLVLIAVLLILVYMSFRFRPAIYGFAAVIGIMHDALVMLSFDAVFRVEIDAATIAAILTILGYSINDTIVIFDRVRENNGLMRGTPLRTILDTSVTQTLSRTFITSGATLLTVISLFILTSGSMKNFALNMIVGIVEGTYSTFISSFIVLEWNNMRERQRKRREMDRYGIHKEEKKPEPRLAQAEIAAEEGQEFTETASSESAEIPRRSESAEIPRRTEWEQETAVGESAVKPVAASRVASDSAVTGSAVPASAPAAGAGASAGPQTGPVPLSPQAQQRPAAQGAGAVMFPGHSGSRKHKKHKRRHH
jgi:preprotein translocase subunit SecF